MESPYDPEMPRINLQLSEDMYARVVSEAQKGGIRHTDWVRDAVAWRLGRLEAATEFEKRLAAVEKALGLSDLDELRQRLDRLERLRSGGDA